MASRGERAGDPRVADHTAYPLPGMLSRSRLGMTAGLGLRCRAPLSPETRCMLALWAAVGEGRAFSDVASGLTWGYAWRTRKWFAVQRRNSNPLLDMAGDPGDNGGTSTNTRGGDPEEAQS